MDNPDKPIGALAEIITAVAELVSKIAVSLKETPWEFIVKVLIYVFFWIAVIIYIIINRENVKFYEVMIAFVISVVSLIALLWGNAYSPIRKAKEAPQDSGAKSQNS